MADFVINVITNTQGAVQGVQQVDRSLTAIERSLNRINRLIGAVFAFQAIAGGVRAITDLADSLTLAQNRLAAVGVEASQTARITATLFDIANRTRTSFDGTAEVFQRVSIALGALGAEEAEVIAFTETLNRVVALSGATTAEAEGALRQFTQGLAANRLSGQELNSVLEQLPFLARIIADELGITTGELRGVANQGLITADVLRNALANAGPEIAARFGNTIPTIAQSFVVLRNNVIEAGGGFLQASGASEGFARTILALAGNIEVVLRAAAALALTLTAVLAGRAIPAVIAGVNLLTAALLRNPFGALALAVTTAVSFLVTFADQIKVTEDGVTSLADVASVAFDRLSSALSGAFTIIGTLVSELFNQFGRFDVSFNDVLRSTAAFADQMIGIVAFLGAAIEAVFADTLTTIRRFSQTLRNFLFPEGTLGRDFIDSIRDSLRILDTGLAEEVEGDFGDVADRGVAELLRRISLGNGPVTEALRSTLSQASQNAQGAAAEAGANLGSQIFSSLNEAIRQEQLAFREALSGLVDSVSEFLGLSTQEFQNFADNVSTILGSVDLQSAFNNALTGIAQLIGVARSELANALGGIFAILNELGVELEDVFGRRGAQAVRILGAVTSEQFQGILAVASGVFGQITGLISGLAPAFSGVIGAAQSFFATLTAGGATATAALAPIAAVIAGIGVIITGTLAIFGAFGERVQRIATILAVVFAPFTFSIQLIVRLVEFLINLFDGLGSAGSTVGRVLTIAFAPIVVPIRLIVEAIQFLIGLFSNLGSVGGTVSRILTVALAPIVIPIRLIIEAVRFLIDLFSNLGGAGRVLGGVLSGVFNGILAVGRVAFQGLQAVGTAVFNVLQATGTAVFNALQAVGRTFLSVFQGIFSTIGNVFRTVFGAIQSFGQTVFNALGAAGRALGGTLTGIFNTVGGVFRTVFTAIRNLAVGVFNAIQSAARAFGGVLSSVFRGIAGVASGVFGAILSAGRAAFNGLVSAARSAGNFIGGILGGISRGIGGVLGGIGRVFGIGSSQPQRPTDGTIGEILNERGVTNLPGVGPPQRRFARGGVFTGPVSLIADGLNGRAFGKGGLLPPDTLLGGLANVTSTASLGIAGEAGPEALFPLARTSRGLGVTATLPPELIQALRNGAVNSNRSGDNITINRIVLISTKSETVEELEDQVLDLNASIEQRVDVRLADVLSEAV